MIGMIVPELSVEAYIMIGIVWSIYAVRTAYLLEEAFKKEDK